MFATTKAASRLSARVTLGCETLEAREVPTVINAYGDNAYNLVVASAASTDVSINDRGWYAEVRDNLTGAAWYFAHSSYDRIWVNGSYGNDRIVNNVSTKPMWAWGYGGDDYLEGYSQNDALYGGDDQDTLVG